MTAEEEFDFRARLQTQLGFGGIRISDERVDYDVDGVIAGVDEVGRGCIAGPVIAGAVILPKNYKNDDIKDSKLISPKKKKNISNIKNFPFIVFPNVKWF